MTMHYEFPRAISFDEVRAIVAKNPNFYIGLRDGYIVVNYLVAGKDTHPPVVDRETAIMRELRGLIFDYEGNVISRRLHKFFNLGEREDVAQIDVSKPHTVLEKLDGSMITPVRINGAIRWCTKMGITEVAGPVEKFVDEHQEYVKFAELMFQFNFTPIFEWCSRQQRIVMDYPEDKLVLIAVRSTATGFYSHYTGVEAIASDFNIPVVETMEPISDLDKFTEELRKREDIEGIVIRFDDGHMVKVKTDTYVALHRAKSLLENERDVVGLILENKTDDLMALLPEEDRDNLLEYSRAIKEDILMFKMAVKTMFSVIKENNMSRKDFALSDCDPIIRTFVFMNWETKNCPLFTIHKFILNHLGSNKSFEKVLRIIKTRWKEKKLND